MKAVQKTRLVEQPYWACGEAEHAHATEPLANACIRASETADFNLAFDMAGAICERVFVPAKLSRKSAQPKAKRGNRGL